MRRQKAALRPLIRVTTGFKGSNPFACFVAKCFAVLAHQGVRGDRVLRDHYGLPSRSRNVWLLPYQPSPV